MFDCLYDENKLKEYEVMSILVLIKFTYGLIEKERVLVVVSSFR
jgi:hypothetical protein